MTSTDLKAIDHHAHEDFTEKTLFGFWIYILSDCMLFGAIFATYQVLHHNTFGGPGPRELFNLPFVLVETLFLLTSSFTCAIGGLFAKRHQQKQVLAWFGATFLLGIAFLCMELYEFSHLIQEGNGWQRSGFLSAFFTLVSTHGAHITAGLLWIAVMMAQVLYYGLHSTVIRRLKCLSLFWHFLDVVWIFIYSVVYLMGVA